VTGTADEPTRTTGPRRDKPPASSPTVSERMSRQAQKNTSVELEVRRRLHRCGLRYRLHVPVPGVPRRTIDIAFPAQHTAIFLDGCFWHGCPTHGQIPRSNSAWWGQKIQGNVDRDANTTAHLMSLGWHVLRFWEHEAPEAVVERIYPEIIARK
jgi:DNA mismatch endonuclease, patch repair protein